MTVLNPQLQLFRLCSIFFLSFLSSSCFFFARFSSDPCRSGRVTDGKIGNESGDTLFLTRDMNFRDRMVEKRGVKQRQRYRTLLPWFRTKSIYWGWRGPAGTTYGKRSSGTSARLLRWVCGARQFSTHVGRVRVMVGSFGWCGLFFFILVFW